MDFKEEIALGIAKVVNLNAEEIKSYIEIPNMQNNIEALRSVVKFIYDNIPVSYTHLTLPTNSRV